MKAGELEEDEDSGSEDSSNNNNADKNIFDKLLSKSAPKPPKQKAQLVDTMNKKYELFYTYVDYLVN
jgi:hypothetical protein